MVDLPVYEKRSEKIAIFISGCLCEPHAKIKIQNKKYNQKKNHAIYSHRQPPVGVTPSAPATPTTSRPSASHHPAPPLPPSGKADPFAAAHHRCYRARMGPGSSRHCGRIRAGPGEGEPPPAVVPTPAATRRLKRRREERRCRGEEVRERERREKVRLSLKIFEVLRWK